MGMKLLSPFQTKDKQQEELARKVMRVQEVEELATKANARLARAEADFAEAMARSREKWALEVEEKQRITSELLEEVKALEKRKEQALIPIQLYKKEADKLIAEAQEIVARAKEKEEQAEFLQEKLEEKLTEVADRESVVQNEEKLIGIAKRGIEVQKEATREGAERLSKEIVDFHLRQEMEEASLLQRKKEVSLAEINFNAKLDKYARDLQALKEWDRQLKDERETLDREYARKKIKAK